MSGENSRHRAKVYCLNDDGQWDDRGTGQAFIQYLPVRQPQLQHSWRCCDLACLADDARTTPAAVQTARSLRATP